MPFTPSAVATIVRPPAVLAVVLPLLWACATSLPDPQSAGAQVYQVRCSGCHALYAPGSLTSAMWEVQVDRMQPVMQRAAVNPLTEQERFLVLSYLKAHATDAPPPSPVAARPPSPAPAPPA